MESVTRNPPKPLVGLRLPEEVMADLNEIADRELITVQQVIRQAIARYIRAYRAGEQS